MQQLDYSYIGVGPIFMRKIGGSGGLVPVGNSSALNFAAQEEARQLRNYKSAGGGMQNEVRRITGVEVSITIHDLSPANLAIALYGSAEAVAGDTVSQEVISVTKGALVKLANPAPTSVVVTEDTDTDPDTYTVGTDYEVRAGGIWFPSDSSIEGATVRVAYEHPGYDVVQALSEAAGEYELLFEGINEARSGKEVVVNAHRVRFGPAANLPLIGDDYAGLELTGNVLADDSQGQGVSAFFTTKLVQ